MNRANAVLGLTAVALAATPALASVGPAPLLGAGLPGLALLVVAGGGYFAVRRFRRSRD